MAAAAEAEAAAAESARREELLRREEREQRLRVTEMLYELKQDAEAQGQDLRRHLDQAQTRDPQGSKCTVVYATPSTFWLFGFLLIFLHFQF